VITDVVALLCRGVFFRAPFKKLQFERLTADQSLKRGNARFIFLDQICSASVVAQRAGSYFSIQMRIRLRERSWRWTSP
jgi:hypothetical protein